MAEYVMDGSGFTNERVRDLERAWQPLLTGRPLSKTATGFCCSGQCHVQWVGWIRQSCGLGGTRRAQRSQQIRVHL